MITSDVLIQTVTVDDSDLGSNTSTLIDRTVHNNNRTNIDHKLTNTDICFTDFEKLNELKNQQKVDRKRKRVEQQRTGY